MAQFRTRKTPLDGVLLIDKPEGFTSHDVVARVRRQLRPAVKKVGHAGTLDPFATGLLVVLVGRATKLARFFVDLPKEYECTLQFGVRSDTGDLTGDPQRDGRRDDARGRRRRPSPSSSARCTQSVPMTSAVKVDGERLYKKAHRGETVETPVRGGARSTSIESSASTKRRRPCVAASPAPKAPTCGSSPPTSARRSAPGPTCSSSRARRPATWTSPTPAPWQSSRSRRSAREPGDEHIPGLRQSGRRPAVHAGHRAFGRPGHGRAQRRAASRRPARARAVSRTAASSSLSTARQERATPSS